MEGASIGAYRVTGVIGRGGMGAVYAAEHALLGRQAAIKVLLPDLSRNQDIVQRFFNEARAATAIRHPGIVEIYDFGWTSDGAAFLVMERLDGETLARRAERGRMRWQAALVVARQIAGALAAAHAKGIVHRDLKPENVFVVHDAEVPGGERIKLLDFGVAKLAGESAPSINVTRTGTVIGTPTYMAPEQCRGVAVDHRVDLYALGCVVFELCSGRPPFIGEGAGDVLAAHIHVPAPRLSAMQVEAPYAVEQLVERLLAKSPADRVQTAEALIRAIDAIVVEPPALAMVSSGGMRLATAASTHTTLSGAASATLPSMRERRERRTVALVIAGAAVATVLVVALVMGRARDAGPIAALPATALEGAPVRPSAPPVPVTPVHEIEPAAGSAAAAPSPVPSAPPNAEPPRPSRVGAAPPSAAAGSPAAEPPARPVGPSATLGVPPTVPANPSGEAAVPARVAPPPRVAPEPAHVVPALSPPRVAAAPSAAPTRVAPAPSPALVDVAVETAPPGATVELAGKVVGKTPFHGTLPRRDGYVPLVVRLEGYADRSVSVRADRAISTRVDLVAVPRAPSRDRGVNPF